MTVDELYLERCKTPSDIHEHLPKLKELAGSVCSVTEFGVREGNSTVALAAGKPARLISYDINPMSVDLINDLQKEIHFDFIQKSSLAGPIEPTDMLFIDTYHTYDQLLAELWKHHMNVLTYIVIHDTVSFGEKGEDGKDGLMKAIKEFMEHVPLLWTISETFTNNNGLTILKRKQETSYIDVHIAYEPCKQLGRAYNRLMRTSKDWTLFLDQDVFICNPNWYEACISAINKIGHKAGWISAVTNRAANPEQRRDDAPKSEDLAEHMRFAEYLWQKYGPEVVLAKANPIFTGFMLLTHKEAWQHVGGFNNGFHVDGTYAHDLIKAGYEIYIMPGLYFYHLQDEKNKYWGYNCWKDYGWPYSIL